MGGKGRKRGKTLKTKRNTTVPRGANFICIEQNTEKRNSWIPAALTRRFAPPSPTKGEGYKEDIHGGRNDKQRAKSLDSCFRRNDTLNAG
jgi:hypothetical protein